MNSCTICCIIYFATLAYTDVNKTLSRCCMLNRVWSLFSMNFCSECTLFIGLENILQCLLITYLWQRMCVCSPLMRDGKVLLLKKKLKSCRSSPHDHTHTITAHALTALIPSNTLRWWFGGILCLLQKSSSSSLACCRALSHVGLLPASIMASLRKGPADHIRKHIYKYGTWLEKDLINKSRFITVWPQFACTPEL